MRKMTTNKMRNKVFIFFGALTVLIIGLSCTVLAQHQKINDLKASLAKEQNKECRPFSFGRRWKATPRSEARDQFIKSAPKLSDIFRQ